jgi:hypothetical protein
MWHHGANRLFATNGSKRNYVENLSTQSTGAAESYNWPL